MWIFTRDGFFSAVSHRTKPDTIIVRARRRSDIDRLAEEVGEPATETPDADYRWRCVMSHSKWVGYVARAAGDIDYPNVKAALATDAELSHAMYEVWNAMFRLQTGALEDLLIDP